MHRFASVSLALLLSTSWSAAQEDLFTTAAADGSFDTLVSLLALTGLDDALRADGSLTVFAPTDEAFAALPAETLASLRRPEGREQLASILTYHVVDRLISVPQQAPAHPLTQIESLNGESLRFRRAEHAVYVNQAEIVQRDVRCSNGNIQVIDAVLLPPSGPPSLVDFLSEDGRFGTLLAALEASGLADAIAEAQDVTVLAPTDAAFARLPEGALAELLQPENQAALADLLRDHVLPGVLSAQELAGRSAVSTLRGAEIAPAIVEGGLRLSGARVGQNDQEAAGALVHVLQDVVLLEAASAAEHLTSTLPELIELSANWREPVVRDGVRAKRLVLRVTGGGSMTLTNVWAEQIETSISGGASLSIAGRAGFHAAGLSGGAVLEASELESDNTEIRLNGGARARVNATESLGYRVNSGAELLYVDHGAALSGTEARYATVAAIED